MDNLDNEQEEEEEEEGPYRLDSRQAMRQLDKATKRSKGGGLAEILKMAAASKKAASTQQEQTRKVLDNEDERNRQLARIADALEKLAGALE